MQGVRAQVTLVEWNFPTTSSDLIADNGIPANINEVLAYNSVGGITYPGGATTNSISATGWDNGINTKSWEVHLITIGYNSISVSSKQRSSNKGPKNFKIIYSIDNGASWTDVPSAIVTVADNWTTGVINNISLPVNSANLVHLRIRWVVTSTVSVDNTTVLSTGTSRIDDIIVKGNVASCIAPTTQVQNITGTASGAQSMVVNWTNGNGDGRIIKINTSNSFTNPVDGVDSPGNAVYAGSGEQIVYNGSGNNVVVTGLEPCVTYWVRAYEYNCSGTNIKYNVGTAVNNPASVSITTVGGGTTTLASENFEGATNWAYTHIASIVGTGGGGVSSLIIKPAPFGFSNSKALVKSHTTDNGADSLSSLEDITFSNINIPIGSTNIHFYFRLASLNALGNLTAVNGSGHDVGDNITVQFNLNNTSWNTCFVQKGFSNLMFNYLPENTILLTWNQNTIFSDPNNTYNYFDISIPNGTANVGVKILLLNNRTGENWCIDEMLLQANTPGVNSLPAVFTISGNTTFCAGSSGTLISLSGSETGVSYQLYLNGNPVGSPVAGTGSAINFGYQNQAGTYTVIATNSTYTNCQSTMTPPLVVTIAPAPTVTNVVTTPASCGSNNGTITVTATGGTPPYQYSKDNGVNYQASNVFSSLPAGTYLIVVKGAAPNSCVSDPPYSAVVNLSGSSLTASIVSQTNVACHGGSTGSVTVQAANGVPAYNYSWNTSPVQLGPTATNLSAGTYTCTITDNAGCTTSITVEITEPLASLSGGIVSQTDVACFGQNTGQAEVGANGGTPGYTYVWNTSPVQNGPIAINLVAGTYNCHITDLNGCFIDIPVTINGPANALIAQATSANVSCFGFADGTANASASGGTAPYTFSWNTTPPQTTATITGLVPGTYTCTITDANLCVTSATVNITQPTVLNAWLQSVPAVICQTSSNGTATVLVSGGTTAYSYLWNTSPPQTGSTATNLPVGNYVCTVTDAHNCSDTVNVTIVGIPPPTTANAGPNAMYCALSFPLNANTPVIGNGMWTQIAGSTAIFNNPPLSNPSQTVTVPSVGSYTFRWTISNGSCPPSTDDIIITIDNNPTGFATSNSPVCEGATLSLTSTLPGSSYEWYDPAMNLIGNAQTCNIPNVTLAHSGTYTVYVNSAACGLVSATTDVTIVATPAAPSSITVTPSGICDNYAGSVTLDAIGGSGDIEWYQGTCSGTPIGNSDPWIINSPPSVTTNYFARYTNAGCVSACTMGTLTVSPQPAADAGVPQSICGSMSTVLAANNPSPNTGVWTIVSGPGSVTFANNALYNTSVSVDQYGEYILRWTVSNALCGSVSDEVKINFSSTVTANANWDSPVCEGSTLHLYCDIGGATYSWTGPNSFASGVQNPVINNVSLAARGLYQVNVSAIPGGCPATSAQTSVYISAAPAEPASVTVDRPVVCAGDGFINLQCSGGSGDIVQWYAGSCGSAVIGTGATLTLPAPSGTTNYFAVWHSDTCGNSVCEQTTVQVYDPPSAAYAGTDQSLCNVFTTYLAATPPVSGTGTWTEDPGNPFPVTIFNVNSATSQIQVPAFGIYKLIWTVSNGVCAPNSQTVQIEFGNNIQVTAQANTPVCEGGTLNLSSSISGATTYSWTGPNGFSSNVISPSVPNVTSANAGDYHLFVNGIPGGCPDSDDIVNVQVSPVPNAPMVVSDGLSGDLQSVCETSSVIYTINSPVPGSTYIWSLDGGGTVYPLSTSDSIQVNWYSGSGTYKITVSESSNAGCSGNAADVNVSVIAQFEPMASVLLNPNPLCEGSMLSLNLATNVPALDALYSWFKNDELIAGTKEFTTEEVADGDEFYSVVMVNSDCSAQPMVTTDKIVLTVLPRPAISIIPSGDLCSGTQITLSASDSYPVYLWQDGSITSSTIVNAFGSYWLRITDADNCSNADTLAIEPCEVENAVLIPNAFSPNGDFNNDIFRVIFSDPDKILRFNMTIYNKWGNLVFESNRATIGWNGYLKNGEPAPGDMYTYSVTYRYKDNPDVKNRKQGLITLLR